MYMYIHIHICIYIYVCIHGIRAHTYICIFLCISIYIMKIIEHTHACTHTHTKHTLTHAHTISILTSKVCIHLDQKRKKKKTFASTFAISDGVNGVPVMPHACPK